VFSQLISEHKLSPDEIDIFIDGSKTLKEDGSCCVDCAIFIPGLDTIYKLKLNNMTNSYIPEVPYKNWSLLPWIKSLICVSNGTLPQINICTDSLSFLETLEGSSLSLFPSALGKLNKVVADLICKITKMNIVEQDGNSFAGASEYWYLVSHETIRIVEAKSRKLMNDSAGDSQTIDNFIALAILSSTVD